MSEIPSNYGKSKRFESYYDRNSSGVDSDNWRNKKINQSDSDNWRNKGYSRTGYSRTDYSRTDYNRHGSFKSNHSRYERQKIYNDRQQSNDRYDRQQSNDRYTNINSNTYNMISNTYNTQINMVNNTHQNIIINNIIIQPILTKDNISTEPYQDNTPTEPYQDDTTQDNTSTKPYQDNTVQDNTPTEPYQSDSKTINTYSKEDVKRMFDLTFSSERRTYLVRLIKSKKEVFSDEEIKSAPNKNLSFNRSYRIVMIRNNGNTEEFLLICKKFTYAFGNIVAGYFGTYGGKSAHYYASNMSKTEQNLLLNNFKFHEWFVECHKSRLNEIENTYGVYEKNKIIEEARMRFEKYMIQLKPALIECKQKNIHGYLPWCFPGGGSKTSSHTITEYYKEAIRETFEEIGVSSKMYSDYLFTKEKTYIDDRIRYKTVYFIVKAYDNIKPVVDNVEIKDAKWLTTREFEKIPKDFITEKYIYQYACEFVHAYKIHKRRNSY